MMEKVVTNKVYNLVNPNGDKLQLRLGMLRRTRDDGVTICADNGWRWSFEGKKIPMPVRSRTWFNGFPEPIMLDWLKANDWFVHTIVNPDDGSAIVFDLPAFDPYDMQTLVEDESEFYKILKELNDKGKFGVAMQLYSYAHEVGHWTARQMVRDICNA